MVSVTVMVWALRMGYKGLVQYRTLDTKYDANPMLSGAFPPFPTPLIEETVPSTSFYSNPSSPYSMSTSSFGSFGSWDS
jgi:hypothetical protein